MFFFLLWRFCKLFLELLTFSCGFFVRTIIAALSSKQCVCLVISKVRSKELLDTILPLSKTLWRIRDKCLKSLIFTDLRVLDWFQSIKVSVNSTGIKDNKACFVGRLFTWGRRSCCIWLAWRVEPDMFTHIILAWSWPKAAHSQNHNTVCNYYFGLMVGQTNILSVFLSRPI